MRTLLTTLALMAGCFALGCRTNTNQFLLEQESRMFEDEVYHLEAQLEACCAAREALARENEDLKRQLGGGTSRPSNDYRAPAASPPGPARRGPPVEAPRLEAPSIELPEATTTPPDMLFPGDEQPMPGPGASGYSERLPVDLVINHRMTGGLDRDRQGGDEGILVVVEPRDEQGNLTLAPGAVSIVLMDPSKTGDAARVARWDFQAHELQRHFKKSAFGQGLQYELKWPGTPPANRDLVLFVRYISPEGAKLTSDLPLAIRLPGDYPRETRDVLVAADTPTARSADRQREAHPVEPRPVRPARVTAREAKRDLPEWKPYR